jgi:hypothetical protein
LGSAFRANRTELPLPPRAAVVHPVNKQINVDLSPGV